MDFNGNFQDAIPVSCDSIWRARPIADIEEGRAMAGMDATPGSAIQLFPAVRRQNRRTDESDQFMT
jgi:hypothetical protein